MLGRKERWIVLAVLDRRGLGIARISSWITGWLVLVVQRILSETRPFITERHTHVPGQGVREAD